MPKRSTSQQQSGRAIAPTTTRAFGTGLTRHGRGRYDITHHAMAALTDKAVAQELGELFRRTYPSPLERIEDVRAWATGVLQRYGMPDQPGMVMIEGDTGWRWVGPEHLIDECQGRGAGTVQSALSFAKKDEESAAWFAAQALELIIEFRNACDRNAGLAAAEVAWQLGALCERCWWKMNHEQAAEDGYRMKEGRKKGAAAGTAGVIQKAAEHREQIAAAARRAWNENKGLVGKHIATARALYADPKKFFSSDAAPLSVERMRKVIAIAHRDGDLGSVTPRSSPE